MTFKFYWNAWRKYGCGKLVRFSRRIQTLTEHYKHILVKYILFYNGKTRFCRWIVSGNKANVTKILCHTKLVTPVSNRGRFRSLKYSFSNFVFMRYAWLIRCYNALKFITLVWSVYEIIVFTFRWGYFFLTSVYLSKNNLYLPYLQNFRLKSKTQLFC